MAENEVMKSISDGFGNEWPLCCDNCLIQVVRPGKVQCCCELTGSKQEAINNLCDTIAYLQSYIEEIDDE